MDESRIITESEKFLDDIDKQKLDLSNLRNDLTDFDSFLEVYEYLNDNLEKLQSMKETMDKRGYTAPFRSLTRYGSRSPNEDLDFDEIRDINRHNQVFRNTASAKKNTFDRVKYAISAHNIALGNLEEFAKIKCKNCNKTYRVSTFLENNKECSCSNGDFELKINHAGVHRLEIIPYLALSGNYMVLRSSLSTWGRESFKRVLNILNQKKKASVKTVTPIITYKEKGRTITKRVSLESEYANNYEEEIRNIYGKGVRIKRLEFYSSNPTIINDKHTRTNLALAYVKHAEDIVSRHEDEVLDERIRNIEDLKKYDEIIYGINLEKPKFIDSNDLESWREEKIKAALKDVGLMDKFGNLRRTLRKDLKERDKINDKLFAELAPTLILWDISKYYLCTSYDRRKRYGSPFPFIRNDIDRQQRRVFANPHREVVEFLRKNEKKHIIAIDEMDLLLYKKFKLELNVKNANFKLNYAALGPALVFATTDYSLRDVSIAYKVGENSIKREIKNIKSIRKPKNKRSSQFLDSIKK